MGSDDLAIVLAWRNHPEVRRHMFHPDEIPLGEHQRWFERESADPRVHLLVLEVDGIARGFAKLRDSGQRVADWGFYVAPDAQRGTGRLLGRETLAHAFIELRLHKVCGQVLARNERSLRFHEHQGFAREGVLRQQHFDGQAYQDVVCFGLLASEWRQFADGIQK